MNAGAARKLINAWPRSARILGKAGIRAESKFEAEREASRRAGKLPRVPMPWNAGCPRGGDVMDWIGYGC